MKLIKLVILLLISGVCFAQDIDKSPKSMFSSANKAFESAEYGEAIGLYEELTSEFESVQLYHNLALAYYYNGELAKSILNMERAARLAPMNFNVRKNLKLLYENVDSDIQDLPPFFLRSWFDSISKLVSPGFWLLTHLILLLLATVLLYFYLIKGFDFNLHFYYVRGTIIGLFVLSMIFASLSYNAHSLKRDSTLAIVMKSNTPLRAGAEDNSLESASLSEGLKVKIEDQISDFYKVKLGDYSEGWVAKKDIVRIIRPQ